MSRENTFFKPKEASSVLMGDLARLIEKIESDPENARINPVDFIDYTVIINGKKVNKFPRAMVETDLAEVEYYKEKFAQGSGKDDPRYRSESTLRGALVESMLPLMIRELSWLGPQVKVIPTSLYDDYKRQIDSAIQLLPNREIKDEHDIRCVGFSIDFTTSLEESYRKVFYQALALYHGDIPSIKYFKTDIVTKEGVKTIMLPNFKVPRVVLSCSGDFVDDASEDFAAYEEGNRDPKLMKKLDDSDVKFYVIRETVAQLVFFGEVIERFLKDEKAKGVEADGKMIDQYQIALDIYDNALFQFQEIIKSLGYNRKMVDEKIKHIPSPTNKFNLDTSAGETFYTWIRKTNYP